MKKFYRVFLPAITCLILGSIMIYIIAQYNIGVESKSLITKVSSLMFVSVGTLFLVTAFRGFFDLIFFVPIYSMIVTVFISYTSYHEINATGTSTADYSITAALLLLLASVLPEIYRRSRIKRLASSCIKGIRLEQFSKKPWKLFDEKPSEFLCTLYFDIPELTNCRAHLNQSELKSLIEEIFAKNFKTIEKYSGTLIRSTEDSMLITFEPLDRRDINIPMEPVTNCAYSAILSALELKQNIEEIKTVINSSSPLIKRLKGRSAIASNEGLILKHIRNGKLELSIFTNSMSSISDMLKNSSGDDIQCDTKTYDLCSEYFSAKKLGSGPYSIVGISN